MGRRERVAVVQVAHPSPAVEGARVRLVGRGRRGSRMPVASAGPAGSLGRLGEYECRLRGRAHAHGHRRSRPASRGRFPFSDARLELGDHLGLEIVSLPVDGTAGVISSTRGSSSSSASSARPGGEVGTGGGYCCADPAGFDFHSVREYEQGESLRRVHWPTTARRGQLMVKELDDAPRDAVVVVLDCDPTGAVGAPPDSSFDTAVRAAGSILRVYAARGRRATLLATGSGTAVDVCSLERLRRRSTPSRRSSPTPPSRSDARSATSRLRRRGPASSWS